jgi:hypothetical protein
MPNLVIRFIDEPDWVSRAITWTTDSLWCHTEAQNRAGTGWTGAHSGTGVETRALNWVKPSRERRYFLPVSAKQFAAAHNFLESQLGQKYNYRDILGLFFHKRIWSPQRVICSQLMLEFMQAAGLQPLNVLADYDAMITPETLHLSPLFIGRTKVPTEKPD